MSIKIDAPDTLIVTGLDWVGKGKISGPNGYYDWEFPDGRMGRTRVFLDSSDMLFGWVKGGRLDWTYWAIKTGGQ